MFLLGPSERDRDREGGREGEWLRLEQRGGDGKKRMNLHDVLQKYPDTVKSSVFCNSWPE